MKLSDIKVDKAKLMGYYFFGLGILLNSGAITTGMRGAPVYLGAFLMCVGCILLSTRIEE